jgi:hypothetical protein
MTRIIFANQRATDTRGVKAVVLGPAGVGKTSLIRGVKLSETLFVNIEAGDLSKMLASIHYARARGRNVAISPSPWLVQTPLCQITLVIQLAISPPSVIGSLIRI